jgi:hypothetical protein
MADNWFPQISLIRKALEDSVRALNVIAPPITIFAGLPGTLSPLPLSLGGDSQTRSDLQGRITNSKAAFFTLLEEKAHFLMLPKTIASTMRDSSNVTIDEKTGGGKATTTRNEDPRSAFMHVPSGFFGLANLGCNLGRVGTAIDIGSDILDSIYHEMTHAWLWLQEFYDADFQKLYTDGLAAYDGATGVAGTQFGADVAFSEAAAYYVGDRVHRWYDVLYGLDLLIKAKLVDPHEIDSRLKNIVAAYNVEVQIYGAVAVGDHTEEKIKSPPLSAELRSAINKKMLDDCPCTKPLDPTLLASISDALKHP